MTLIWKCVLTKSVMKGSSGQIYRETHNVKYANRNFAINVCHKSMKATASMHKSGSLKTICILGNVKTVRMWLKEDKESIIYTVDVDINFIFVSKDGLTFMHAYVGDPICKNKTVIFVVKGQIFYVVLIEFAMEFLPL